MKIMLAFDFDYLEDYDAFEEIQKVIDVPCTVFLIGSRHPEKPFPFKENILIGNHSFRHEEWYEKPVEHRITDLMENHGFLKKTYNVDCNVYRSPHLRNFPDTADAMEQFGYLREMDCSPCPLCPPMVHSHLKKYFSSHHHFAENACPLEFEDAFERICKEGKDFTFFLDPSPMLERLDRLRNIISIGQKYGEFCAL